MRIIESIEKRKAIITIVILLGITRVALTQSRGWEVGGDFGIAHYFGDLNSDFNVSHPGGAGSLKARYNFNSRIAIAGGGRYAFIQGRDEWSDNDYHIARNLGFRSHVFEIFTQLEFNFMEYGHSNKLGKYSPYLFVGPMVSRINPQNRIVHQDGSKEWYYLRPLRTEGQKKNQTYLKTNFAFIYGIGFKYNLTNTWSINVELAGRKFYTDYIDDVSTVYPNKDKLQADLGDLAVYFSDPSFEIEEFPDLGELGRQRGTAETNDMYTTLSIGITYFFSYLPCPEISKHKSFIQ